MNEFLANEDLPSEAELLGANLASSEWNRGFQVSTQPVLFGTYLTIMKLGVPTTCIDFDGRFSKA